MDESYPSFLETYLIHVNQNLPTVNRNSHEDSQNIHPNGEAAGPQVMHYSSCLVDFAAAADEWCCRIAQLGHSSQVSTPRLRPTPRSFVTSKMKSINGEAVGVVDP
jgi:hypothetical protein